MTGLEIFLAVAITAAAASPLAAQQWPTRTIRIVTGTPAGGSPDIISRLIGDKLAERLGQAVVVENSSSTGVAAWAGVAKSQADGYLYSMLTGPRRAPRLPNRCPTMRSGISAL